jgi:hypothetical protein
MSSDVWSKLRQGAYNARIPYPESPSKPVLPDLGSPNALREYADALELYETQMQSWRERVAVYNKEVVNRENEFQRDLESYYEMTDHPKAGLLYAKAWQNGHSSGLDGVASVYDDLVELVK